MIRKHDDEYGYKIIALRDPEKVLVKESEAQITPEAAVFDARGRLVYHGRIDNLYADIGRARTIATTHELEDAIEAAAQRQKTGGEHGARRGMLHFGPGMKAGLQTLSGFLALFALGTAGISGSHTAVARKAEPRGAPSQESVTFNREIAPIIFSQLLAMPSSRRIGTILAAHIRGREIARAANRLHDEQTHHAAVAARSGRAEVRG